MFPFQILSALEEGMVWGLGSGVGVQVPRESTVSSTAPGSCFIPESLNAAIHLKSNSQSKRRVLDILPSLCKYRMSCDPFSNAFTLKQSHTNALFALVSWRAA